MSAWVDETQGTEHLHKNLDEVVESSVGLVQELNLRFQV